MERRVLEQQGEDASINRFRLTDRATGSWAILGFDQHGKPCRSLTDRDCLGMLLTTSAEHDLKYVVGRNKLSSLVKEKAPHSRGWVWWSHGFPRRDRRETFLPREFPDRVRKDQQLMEGSTGAISSLREPRRSGLVVT